MVINKISAGALPIFRHVQCERSFTKSRATDHCSTSRQWVFFLSSCSQYINKLYAGKRDTNFIRQMWTILQCFKYKSKSNKRYISYSLWPNWCHDFFSFFWQQPTHHYQQLTSTPRNHWVVFLNHANWFNSMVHRCSRLIVYLAVFFSTVVRCTGSLASRIANRQLLLLFLS